jgi:hypothetical protein
MSRRPPRRPASTRPPTFDTTRARTGDADDTPQAQSVKARHARTRAYERLFATIAGPLTEAAAEARAASLRLDWQANNRAQGKILELLRQLGPELKERVMLCRNYHCPRLFFLAGSVRARFCSPTCRQAATRARRRVTQ